MTAPTASDPRKLLTVSLPMHPLGPAERRFFERHPVGGVCLFRGSLTRLEDVARLVTDLRGVLGPDLLVSIDQEGGSVVRLPGLPVSPGGRVLGEGDDPGRTGRISHGMARGLRALGINVNFAPLLDVNTNPLNPVIGERAFGTAPEVVTRHGLAFLRGHHAAGVMAVAKHYPGHGDADVDSHLALPTLDRTQASLDAVELAPFRAAIQDGLQTIMTAHLLLPRIAPEPATVSTRILGDLRSRLGFGGLVYTDALHMGALLDLYPQAESARLSIEAGADHALIFTPDLAGQEPVVRDFAAAPPGDEAVARSLRRWRAALARFPFPEPDPRALEGLLGDESVWRDIEDAARAAVRVRGEVPLPLAREQRLLALVPEFSDGGAASDRVPLAPELTALLREHFPACEVVPYGAAGLDVGGDASDFSAAVLFTARRVALGAEVELARGLAAHPRALHVNLWNPELSGGVPLPALNTFGFQPASLRAAVSRLAGGR
ncbi:glycoside hydrolase family 3 N-terminal domain-containing protein [Deinococcus aestuarii]|uniref:glycoside hydrolase family 3 N-terminal domain-containing protein n=1 Tax=Deinococcus aestuarii TaxID=2774531 RepID=UPI001C0BD4CE|nr:glycoside hydrolase family 3 N-terminal domain-containing protein [Deinococcus aestuarii]